MGIWGCRLTLALIYYGIWDLPFYLAIGDKLFGTYRIAHRIGGLFVVCCCSGLRILGGGLYYLSRHYLLYASTCVGLPFREAVVMTMKIRPGL